MPTYTAPSDIPGLQPGEYAKQYEDEQWFWSEYDMGQVAVGTYTEPEENDSEAVPVRLMVADQEEPEAVVHEVWLSIEDAVRFHQALGEAIERAQQGR